GYLDFHLEILFHRHRDTALRRLQRDIPAAFDRQHRTDQGITRRRGDTADLAVMYPADAADKPDLDSPAVGEDLFHIFFRDHHIDEHPLLPVQIAERIAAVIIAADHVLRIRDLQPPAA